MYSALLALITSNYGESGLSPMKLKRDQVLCGRRQDFVSGFSDKNHIFNANSTLFWNVDARLNRNDHPRRKFLGLAFCQPRLLMYLDSHSMPRGMGKESVKARFLQYFTPGAVHFTSLDAGRNCSNRSHLGFPHRFIHAPVRPGNRSGMHGTSHVGTVTCEYNTVIQDNKSLRRNGLRRRAAVWQRGTRPCGHNRIE